MATTVWFCDAADGTGAGAEEMDALAAASDDIDGVDADQDEDVVSADAADADVNTDSAGTTRDAVAETEFRDSAAVVAADVTTATAAADVDDDSVFVVALLAELTLVPPDSAMGGLIDSTPVELASAGRGSCTAFDCRAAEASK